MIARIEEIGAQRAANPIQDSRYDPPYQTFITSIIEGESASNATASRCTFDWEYRQMPGEDGAKTIAEIKDYRMTTLLPAMTTVNTTAGICIITEAPVPGLDDRNAAKAAAFVSDIAGLNSRGVVSFAPVAAISVMRTFPPWFLACAVSAGCMGRMSISRSKKRPRGWTECKMWRRGCPLKGEV